MSRAFSCRLTDALHERLDRFARHERRSKTAVIVRAIESFLNQQERLASEARRQSLLASALGHDPDCLDEVSTAGWK
jgi:predicted transcriptional regulator